MRRGALICPPFFVKGQRNGRTKLISSTVNKERDVWPVSKLQEFGSLLGLTYGEHKVKAENFLTDIGKRWLAVARKVSCCKECGTTFARKEQELQRLKLGQHTYPQGIGARA